MKIGTDAVLLGAWVSVGSGDKVLDIGTGCGVIAMMLAQRGAKEIDAIDIDLPSIEEARRNFRDSPWPSGLTASFSSLQDWRKKGEGYSLIISNPPFFLHQLKSRDNRRSIARHADYLSPEELAFHAHALCSRDGRAAFIFPLAVFESFHLALSQAGWYLSLRQNVITCFGAKPALVLSEWKKSPCYPETIPPLQLRDQAGEWHPDYKSLTADFYPHF